jgi:hypothetical protein
MFSAVLLISRRLIHPSVDGKLRPFLMRAEITINFNPLTAMTIPALPDLSCSGSQAPAWEPPWPQSSALQNNSMGILSYHY